MSHFSVLVVGENVEAQLARYHEFECTGLDDEYVQDVDKTAEARAEYDKYKVKRLRNTDGVLFDPYEDRFYLDPTPEELKIIGHPIIGSGCGSGLSWTSKDWNDGRGYRAKVRMVPSSWEEVEVPIEQVQSFAEWAADWYGMELLDGDTKPDLTKKHKYGYISVRRRLHPNYLYEQMVESLFGELARGNSIAMKRASEVVRTALRQLVTDDPDAVPALIGRSILDDVEVVSIVDRTNPNKKWDWWQLGGRWTGFFKMKPNRPAAAGSPGLMTEPAKDGHGDVAKKRDVDFDGMRDEAGSEAAERWDKVRTVAVDLWESWEQVRERIHGPSEPFNRDRMDEARQIYRDQPSLQALHGNPRTRDLVLWDADKYLAPREEYIQRARDGAVSTFAVVKDGEWYERGKMGWWGIVSDEKDGEEWDRQFAALLDELPDDTLLSIVDCHI